MKFFNHTLCYLHNIGWTLLVSESRGKGFISAGWTAHILRQSFFLLFFFNHTKKTLFLKKPQDKSVPNTNTFCLPAVHQRRRLDWILTAVLMNEVSKVDEEVCCLWHPVIRPGGEMELAHRVALWCVGLKGYTLKKKTGFRGQQQGFLPRPGQSSASPEVPVTSCAVIWAVTFQFPSFFCSGREYFEVIPFTFHFTSRPSLLPYICWQRQG